MSAKVGWVRGALTDNAGNWDVAYISLAGVGAATLGSIPFMCVMSAVAYARCVPKITETAVVQACTYDPQPLGIAIGSACAGFAAAMTALAAYMAATKRPAAAPATP